MVLDIHVRRSIFWHVRLDVSRFGVTPVSSRLYNCEAVIPFSTKTFSKEARCVVSVSALHALHRSLSSFAGRPKRIVFGVPFQESP